MSQLVLNHTMVIYVYKERTDEIDIGNIATTFMKEKILLNCAVQ